MFENMFDTAVRLLFEEITVDFIERKSDFEINLCCRDGMHEF
jgi:hypothetical protein